MKRRTQETWQRLVQQHAQSNLSVQAFCRQQGFSQSCFYRYKARFSAPSENKTGSPFIKAQPSRPESSSSLCITLHHQHSQIRLPMSTDVTWLAELVKALS